MKRKSEYYPSFKDEGEVMARWGEAELIKYLDGKTELRGGSDQDRAEAKEWMSLFWYEAIFEDGVAKTATAHSLWVRWQDIVASLPTRHHPARGRHRGLAISCELTGGACASSFARWIGITTHRLRQIGGEKHSLVGKGHETAVFCSTR
jgi:hypothetical protein